METGRIGAPVVILNLLVSLEVFLELMVFIGLQAEQEKQQYTKMTDLHHGMYIGVIHAVLGCGY